MVGKENILSANYGKIKKKQKREEKNFFCWANWSNLVCGGEKTNQSDMWELDFWQETRLLNLKNLWLRFDSTICGGERNPGDRFRIRIWAERYQRISDFWKRLKGFSDSKLKRKIKLLLCYALSKKKRLEVMQNKNRRCGDAMPVS